MAPAISRCGMIYAWAEYLDALWTIENRKCSLSCEARQAPRKKKQKHFLSLGEQRVGATGKRTGVGVGRISFLNHPCCYVVCNLKCRPPKPASSSSKIALTSVDPEHLCGVLSLYLTQYVIRVLGRLSTRQLTQLWQIWLLTAVKPLRKFFSSLLNLPLGSE
jgi:hypothetical protein